MADCIVARPIRQVPIMVPICAGLLAALTSCAAPSHTAPPVRAAAPALTGSILSSRQVILQIAGAGGGVLGALSAPASTGEDLAPATEFIVREQSGTVISVMEPQPTTLHPGERVGIVQGINTRLVPLTDPAT